MIYRVGTGIDLDLDSDYRILVRLLFLLGFTLGLICKMGIFMHTLQGCFRNKNRRIHVKHSAEEPHIVSAQQMVCGMLVLYLGYQNSK